MIEWTIAFCLGSFGLGFTLGAIYHHLVTKADNHEDQESNQ